MWIKLAIQEENNSETELMKADDQVKIKAKINALEKGRTAG